MINTKTAEECCPKFDPEPWQEKEIVWKDKNFIKETVPHSCTVRCGYLRQSGVRMWKKIRGYSAKRALMILGCSRQNHAMKGERLITPSAKSECRKCKIFCTYMTRGLTPPTTMFKMD
jgi:hypothetical protein